MIGRRKVSKLIITIDIPTASPQLDDPWEVAEYCLDQNADDPVWEFLYAEWKDERKFGD